MTDFSPLDSALYESTPEKIAASLRYLRKTDAVMAALMPLSASTPAPPAAVPADGWKEVAIAWEVCASIHRKYAKGRDALFSTRQQDFVSSADKARAMLAAAKGEK